MNKLVIEDVSGDLIPEFSAFCVNPERRENPIFSRGISLKEAWARANFKRGEKFAKVAFWDGKMAGIIQFRAFPYEGAIKILCLFVPHRENWKRGIGSSLLNSLVEEASSPGKFFEHQRASIIFARPFSGELEGQLSLRDFFLKKGFRLFEKDPDLLILPLGEEFRWKGEGKPPLYIAQDDDLDKALILFEPSFCPWDFFFYMRAQEAIKREDPQISLRWINRVEEPQEFEKRGGFEGVVVRGTPIRAFVGDEEEFSRELKAAFQS
ncbi:MAG: GNAT family N-acetyltransferase [Caldiserica bacterium]|jgi:hypothetical protein|nr:GNAT family N-acetyltransferase [Caldisericota bacterium]MDH7562005.1 GNAT family N-acetyltransferase [Caldisericota bacterium]